MRSHVDYLINNYNLSKVEELVLGGAEAGAVGCSLWANYIEGKS